MKSPLPLASVVALFLLGTASGLRADGGSTPADDGSLVDFKKDSAANLITNNNGGVGTIDKDAGTLKVTMPAGKGYPGVQIVDPNGMWNLTGFTGVNAEVKNTGKDTVKVALRVDGGDNWQNQPWDCESSSIAPGETISIHVTFGQSYGTAGYKMPADHVLHVLLFTQDPETESSIEVKSLKATK